MPPPAPGPRRGVPALDAQNLLWFSIPIRQVLVQQLQKLPDLLPGDNLVEVARTVTEEWARLMAEKES
ncbi:MAG TPA: hypothetical protein ENJ95_14235 [Bacteroidetes bacterium]|nr:hypothetical protein [Bacteroidota bacterium]